MKRTATIAGRVACMMAGVVTFAWADDNHGA